MIEKLDIEAWMLANSKLQQKKNKLRKDLYSRGMLQRDGNNTYDRYKYFSEAQYKLLFTELFSENGLELKFSEVSYDTFDGTEKQANGRMTKLEFTLFDIDTGFYEKTIITGEGIDKGDKAGYKAYTGALKYYLADTFMVATGDDPEKESPDYKMNKKTSSPQYVSYIRQNCTPEQIDKLLARYNVSKLEDISAQDMTKIMLKLNERFTKEPEVLL